MVINRDWSHLPPELLNLIVPHIVSISDFIRFRSVCTSWRSAAPPLKPRPQPPVLLLPYNASSPYRSFFSLATRRARRIFLPHLVGKRILNSNRGWMLLVDIETNALSLFNPITLAQFQLPPTPSYGDPPFDRIETSILSNFLFHDRDSDNFVVLIPCFDINCKHIMMFWKNGDESWTELTCRVLDAYGIAIYHKGKFYDNECDLFFTHEDRLAFAHQSEPVCLDESKANVFYHLFRKRVPSNECVSEISPSFGTVLFCKGIRRYFPRWKRDISNENFSLCKLDYDGQHISSSSVQLKDYALFISTGQCTICCVKDFPQYKENCVYSTQRLFEDYSQGTITSEVEVGILNIKDFTSYHMPCRLGDPDRFTENPMWITLSLKK